MATAKKDTTTSVVYSVDEFAEASQAFGTSADVIRAAFLVAGKTEATEKEAKELINRFKKKEVR